MLPVNQVFQVGERRFRLVWANGNLAFWIDIDSPVAWPKAIRATDLQEMLIEGSVTSTDDPYLDSILRSVEPGTLEWRKRDSAWLLIKDGASDPELFDRKQRGLFVRKVMERHSVTHQTVNRLLRRYWQRGMSYNALLPDYHKSGAPGQKRSPGEKKLGRPRTVKAGTGCNITSDIEKIFRRAIEINLLKLKPTSITDAHAKAINALKVMRPDMPPIEQPTTDQFRYFYQRAYPNVEVLKKQKSPIDYASNFRPLLGTSTTEVLGPGYRYQIDATIADIYLLSEHDRSRIVGRPVVYLVKDVFSRMVTGLYVGFEGPSWTSAMIALANTIECKVQFCERYGIEIEESQWPVQGLPNRILADKGEFNGTRVESFCSAFGTTIENATARRGDAKGIVERHFRTVQETFKPYVEGVVGPELSKKRGGTDYREDATLTLSEFTKIIIASVIFHNNYQPLAHYDRCEGMAADIPAVPLHLWNWGVTNLTGRLRTAPMDLVRINLMPHATATLSPSGIRLFDCFYTCAEAVEMGWFDRAKNQRPEKISVAYDPQSANHIYLRPTSNMREYWTCHLMDRSRRFRNLSFWDVWPIIMAEKKADAKASQEKVLARGELLEQIETISKHAEEQKPQKGKKASKGLGLQIRNNKQEEKQRERLENAFKPPRPDRESPGKVVPFRKDDETGHAYPDMTDLLFEDDSDE